MTQIPHFNIDPKVFWNDPYPILAKMRTIAPMLYVPEFERIMFVKRDIISTAEPQIEVFSSEQPNGLMTQLLGQNLMRKDGDPHRAERKAMFPSVSPKTARDHWTGVFRSEAEDVLSDLRTMTSGDLFYSYATRLSAQCLIKITGLETATWQQMDVWSQAMIDGISNYSGDPDIERRCKDATAAVDKAIDAMSSNANQQAYDMLSVMRAAGLPGESIRANIKLAITGGQNEPRDVIAGAVWALLSHPEQLHLVQTGEASWMQVFEEFVRWLSPIGMSPRIIAKDHSIDGMPLHKGDNIFFMLNSANHDEAYFTQPEQFDITRDASKHIAFGAGPHFCAGAWISKALVADIALPMLFEALPNLRLGAEKVRLGGWAFRGVLNLPCEW